MWEVLNGWLHEHFIGYNEVDKASEGTKADWSNWDMRPLDNIRTLLEGVWEKE